MTKITASVKLTAYNMGSDATEQDFDDWCSYVAEHIDAECGFSVEVDSYSFTGRNAGGASDEITGADDDQRETIEEALRTLWERGCAENFNREIIAAEPDFETMTAAQALDILVELDVAKWGEQEREASRQMHAHKSRGLLINSIVHHQSNGYGEVFDAVTKKIAKKQLTSDDMSELRKGG